jgi:site-specific recombinase XerD
VQLEAASASATAPASPFRSMRTCSALANAGHDTRRIQDWLGHRSIAHLNQTAHAGALDGGDMHEYIRTAVVCAMTER